MGKRWAILGVQYPLGNSHIISHPKNRDGTGRSSKVAWKGIWGMVVPSRVAYLEMLINVEYPWIFLNWVSTHNVPLHPRKKTDCQRYILILENLHIWKIQVNYYGQFWRTTATLWLALLRSCTGQCQPPWFSWFFSPGHWCVFVRFKKKNKDLFTQKIWSTSVVWPSSRVYMIWLGRGFAKTHPRVFFAHCDRRNPKESY